MSMRLFAGVSGIMLAASLAVYAGQIAADSLPLPNRVATAEVVVFGRVTEIEPKTVAAPAYPWAPNTAEFKVAKIAVIDPVTGVKDLKPLRLGFVPTPPGVAIRPQPFVAEVGMEGCFFLIKIPGTDLLITPGPTGFLSSANPGYEKDAALVKKCGKILQDADATLKGKDAEDRFLAAAMLVARYTTRHNPKSQLEPIDAAQSKRILETLAAADWTPQTDFTKLSPRMVLTKLPLTAKDGWDAPKPNDAKAFNEYAKRWVTEHAATYRIQRWAMDK